MYNKKSDYAVNKRTPDAIVYTDADGTEIKLTRDDFDSEEEFIRWKKWSDEEYQQTEKKGRGYDDHTVSLIDGMDTYGESLEDELIALTDKLEHDTKCAAMVAQIREVLTETQFRRLWMHYAKRFSVERIAQKEKVSKRAIQYSISDAKKKFLQIYNLDTKKPSQNG